MKQTITELLLRDLQKLEEEIKSFSDESQIWKTSGDVTNSAGNLCLHLCGNLQHFIGAILGNTGYVRNRDAEFSLKDISKEKLIEEIAKTKAAVSISLDKLADDELQKPSPKNFQKDVTIEYFLLHLFGHLNYHLGQINYLRRILS